MSEREEHPAGAAQPPVENDAPTKVELRLCVGTGGRAVLGAVAGILVALGLLYLGFWQTLLIVVFAAAGVFLAAVEDKPLWVKNTINRLFPPRDA